MPTVDLTLDKELYESIRDVAHKLRLPPRMFLRALIATIMEEARKEAESETCEAGQGSKQEVTE